MLTSQELKSYAHLRRIKLIDQAWKDYLQDLTLHLLYKKYPQILFRGGTCIWKVMKGDRFSEDLDLCLDTIPNTLDTHLVKELKLFGFTCTILKKKQTANMLFLHFGITSPAHPREITISIEILMSKSCDQTIKTLMLYSPYPDIPPIEVRVPSREDIIVDKISAIIQRNKARDVHDLYLLLKQGGTIDSTLVSRKILGFTPEKLKEKIIEKKILWKSLEPLIVTKLPSLEEEMKYILSFFT
ncbi:MAG: nucleotidyl transferase AbiEii/AbiGii toxin family protein [Thermoplasmata archaeon]|nr:nucleotidyl transferase AbiEii/AbiGii toxin family protein [Thermoplasmata archaeon]